MSTSTDSKKKQGRKTKLGAIIKHLIRYGSITDLVARNKYHTNRLSGYIYVLRVKRNWKIESEWCNGRDEYGKTRYVKYRLVEKGV